MELDSVSDDSYPVVELEEALRGLDVSSEGEEASSHWVHHACLSAPPPSQGDSTLLEFMKVLALCHTVIPEREEGGVVYRASSPG